MEDVSYCKRNITQNDGPGNIEIVAPPVFLTLLIFTGKSSRGNIVVDIYR